MIQTIKPDLGTFRHPKAPRRSKLREALDQARAEANNLRYELAALKKKLEDKAKFEQYREKEVRQKVLTSIAEMVTAISRSIGGPGW